MTDKRRNVNQNKRQDKSSLVYISAEIGLKGVLVENKEICLSASPHAILKERACIQRRRSLVQRESTAILFPAKLKICCNKTCISKL